MTAGEVNKDLVIAPEHRIYTEVMATAASDLLRPPRLDATNLAPRPSAHLEIHSVKAKENLWVISVIP